LAAGVIFSVLDITERKQAEGERERLLQAIDQSGETIVITDSEGTIQYVNPAFEKITGYTCDEAIGQNPRILKSNKHDETFYQQMWGKLVGGDIWRGQLTNKKKDGTLYIEEAVISPVSDTSGSIVNFVAVKRDITESNQLQEEILKRARLASLGELSAGVAHEINNPNALILYNSDILTAVFKDLLPWLKENQLQTAGQLFGGLSYRDAIEEIPLLLPAIHDAAQRIKRIVDDLRDFSRQDSSAADEAVDVNLVIQSAIRLANNTIKKATDCFELHLTAALPAVSGVKGRLEQVVINLLLNACQALESRSQKITVTTQYAADTDQLQVLVADEGEGVPAEVAAHILEPFVTTKREQGGTGLGLSVSARIVKEHHGELKFTSSPGKGTIFTLSLPTRKEINHGS
ncbi:MAG: PAS domain S-box protein, partial [Thermodesulfobacteriota bacterium]|nr:PAS domain S-box protein [Thermodesulfobacteriota bacterium]